MDKPRKYDVHHYLLVRVKCEGVKAPDQVSAIKQTEDSIAEWANKYLVGEAEQREFAYAEETIAYLVDEVGDEEYHNTMSYQRDDAGEIVPVGEVR